MQRDDDRRLDAAVALNIITAEQAEAIRALVPQREATDVPRPFAAATIGYVLGAITVIVAMGWFLADRWEWLGAAGVLAVTTLYAGLFLIVARRLRSEGYPQASGFAVLLAVAMVPVATVALSELFGLFEPSTVPFCRVPDFYFWGCRGEEILVELTTIAAALFALRRVRFSLLVLPIALIAVRFVFHISDAFWRSGLFGVSAGWVWMIATSLLAAAAYATDRAQRGDEDFALWLHLAAAFSAVVASTMLISAFENFRQLLIPGALLAFAFSLRMRRFAWTILGMGWFVAYLGWLAAEVFRETPFFPIVLAALGIGVIIATVWVQRNSAMLVARFGGLDSAERPSFPGGVGLLLLPAVLAMLKIPGATEYDRAARRAAEAESAMYRARARAQPDSVPQLRKETLPRTQP